MAKRNTFTTAKANKYKNFNKRKVQGCKGYYQGGSVVLDLSKAER